MARKDEIERILIQHQGALAEEYGVNLDVVWGIIQIELPHLVSRIKIKQQQPAP